MVFESVLSRGDDPVDFSDVPFVDQHAHALTHVQPENGEQLRSHFTEANEASIAVSHVGSSVAYRWALHQLSRFLRIEAREEAILQARAAIPLAGYTRKLARDANIGCIVLDEGFPPAPEAYSTEEVGQMLGIPVARVLRIESHLEQSIARFSSFADVVVDFDSRISGVKSDGYVGLKSIAAYRTGLHIGVPGETEAEHGFHELRQLVRSGEKLRLASKPVIDFFVMRALRVAAAQQIPFQFHTGYGDPDLDLRLANPLHLRPIFEDSSLVTVPIVMLHGSVPYTAEGAYLAAVYPNAYLDISFSLPPLDHHVLEEVVGAALGIAPATKLMCSSDGTRIPEHYWLGATRARQVLSSVFTSMCHAGDMSPDEAKHLGRLMLSDNATRLYGLNISTVASA